MLKKANKQRLPSELGTEPIGKLLWAYSLPTIVGTLVNALYNIVDRIFIGQGVGPMAISGHTLTFPMMMIFSWTKRYENGRKYTWQCACIDIYNYVNRHKSELVLP